VLILAGVAGAGAITWGYWIFKIRPRIEAIEGRGPVMKAGRFRPLATASAGSEFDRSFTLPGSPLGAAWDGRHLIVGDRKGGALRIRFDGDDMDAQSAPILEPVYRQNVGVSALTWNGRNFVGYADAAWFQKGEIWITDYGDNRLQRLQPATRLAWAGGAASSTTPVLAGMIGSPAAMNREPVHFARDEERSPERPEEDSEVLDWQVELRGNAIYGSWRIWFGDKLFSDVEQTSTFITVPKFAKYTFTIRDPTGAEVKKEFEASRGENVMRDVHLAEASLPGEYRVDLFIHVQYVTAEGQGRILNNSEMGLELRK
jgi:hypothetical protein